MNAKNMLPFKLCIFILFAISSMMLFVSCTPTWMTAEVPANTAASILTVTPMATETPSLTMPPTATETPAMTSTPAPTATITPTVVELGKTPCAGLQDLELLDTTITSSEIVWQGWKAPLGGYQTADQQVVVDSTFCRVTGTIAPSINFEVWMPLATREHPWNGKFIGVGNSGLAGTISYSQMRFNLIFGYATASTDTGHQSDPTEGQWMLEGPALWVDFSYRAIHLMTRNAKAIIQAYYGNAPRYSYFNGCSGGGQQGLMEAQRYPADYDGIVAGAPANLRTHSWPGEVWVSYVTHRSPENAIPEEKLPTIQAAAIRACDADDGLVDGVISDPINCRFDPSTLLCRGTDNMDCLTDGEVDSLNLIYAGLYDPVTGGQFWPGLEPGSELGWTGWGGLLPEPFPAPLAYFQYMLFADEPDWDWTSFDFTDPLDFETIIKADALYGPIFNANSPDLSAFQELGGKLIIYHGWFDQQIAPRNSINYYNNVAAYMGGEANTQDFLRLYMIPGMMHCGGTQGGPSIFNTFQAIELWVEKGIPPANMVSPEKTRSLCAYPQVAMYSGTGNVDDAKSFICANP